VSADAPRSEHEAVWKVALLDYVLPVVVYAGAAVGITWPAVTRLSTHVATELDGAFQGIWHIWWIHRALAEGRWFYACDLLFHPAGSDLYFDALGPATSVPAALLVFAGLTPAAAFNVMVLLGLALGGWAQFLLARRLGVGRWAALVAGAAFSFGPFHAAHTVGGHLQLMGVHWVSFYLVALLGLFETPNARRAAATAVLLALVTMTDWHLLATAVLLSIALFVGHAFRERFLLSGRRWGAIGIAAAVYVLLAGPLLWKTIALATAEELSPARATWLWAADVQTLVLPNQHMLWGRDLELWRSWTGDGIEASAYLGLVLIALAVVAIKAQQKLALTLLVTGLAFGVLTLGPYLHWGGEIHLGLPLPYRLLERYVPMVDLLGNPARLAGGAAICLTLAAALGIDALLANYDYKRVLAVVLGLAAIAELAPAPFPSTPLPTAEAIAELAREPGAGAVIDTHPGPLRLFHQTLHGRPLVMGHAARYRMRLFGAVADDAAVAPIFDLPGRAVQRLERVDSQVMFDWGEEPPAPGVAAEGFEARWRGEVLVPFAGRWRFYADADDGCRLRIDGRPVIDSWWRRFERRVPGEVALGEGWHRFELDAYDRAGPAKMELRWARGEGDPSPIAEGAFRVAEGQPGLQATYFDRTDALPEGGRDAALARLRELGVRWIVKPATGSQRYEASLGLVARREGDLLIFDVNRAGDAVEPRGSDE
jgi:hypothetical protein